MDSIVQLDKEEVYSCRICSFGSMQIHHYMKHITTHVFQSKVIVSRDKFHHCDKCRCAFLTDNALKLHRMGHVIKAIRVKKKNNEARYLDEKYVKRYSCSECDYKFVLKSTLEMHMEAHKPLKHVCSCGIAYYEKNDLNGHIKLVHKNKSKEAKTEKITKMPAVTVKLEYASDLDETENNYDLNRIKEKTSKKKFKIKIEVETDKEVKSYYRKNPSKIISCNNCDLTFTLLDMRKHVEEMHKDIPYSCRCCCLRFATKELVEEHRNSMHRTKTCNICRKKFMTKASLENHIMISHNPNSRPYYICPICKKCYAQQASLNVHLLRHKGEKCFECKTCSKKFYDRHALGNHERTHTGEKPYVCQYCNKPFSDPSAVIRHVRIHTKEYRYFCTECPEKFTDASSLIRHKRKHGKGQKDLKVDCDICGKSISNQHNLKHHKLAMHAERKREFECHDCGKKFTSKGNLFLHITRMHSDRPKCAYCGRRFENKKALQRHKEKCHPIILYCSSCPLKFHRENSFQKHKLVCSQRRSEKKD